MYSIAALKVGTAIQIDGEPYVVLTFMHSKQARGGGVAKTTIKNLITGAVIPKTFQGSEKIEPAEVGFKKAQYLYNDDNEYHFMFGDTFEQFSFTKEELGDDIYYLLDGTDVSIQVYDDKPINVQVPPKVELKVVETEPGVRGDTASGGSKPAKLETGKTVQVPLFINIGDTLRINTQTGEYVERAK
ncbi:elongation factor P [Patescibacteria group bacterium]|nr:elongation factor P [Patescibacteria group bacterium]